MVRLDKRGFLKADVIGERHNPPFGYPGHGFHVFREAAAVRRESAGQTGRLVQLALREETAFAIETLPAGNVMKTHYPAAQSPFLHATANGNHRARQFTSRDVRWRNSSVKNLLDVGAADPAGSNLDENFAIAYLRYGDLLDAYDSLFSVDTGAHRFGDGGWCLHGFQRCFSPAHPAWATSLLCNENASLRAANSGMKLSRKLPSDSAALWLCVPKRRSPGTLVGCLHTCPSMRFRLLSLGLVPATFRSMGKPPDEDAVAGGAAPP